MNRKLLILDVALVAVLAWSGYRFRNQWRVEKTHQAATLGRKVKPADPPPFTPLPPSPAVLASNYALIAQKMLLDKSRNPDVVVEVPPPPPPKPIPPLPSYHGTMNLGDGPLAVLSLPGDRNQQEVHIGQMIGPFKLVDVNVEEIALEWEGKVVRKRIDKVQVRASTDVQRTRQPEPVAAVPQPRPGAPLGPGQDSGRGFKDCQPNDSNPSGAVVDGYRKTESSTPFGHICRWYPVGQ